MARNKYKWRIAGFIIKALCTLVIAAVVILLLWRIIDSNIAPREVDTITVNDKLADAYEKNDGNLEMHLLRFVSSQQHLCRENVSSWKYPP